MATFTKIVGDETPLIEVDAGKRLSKIDPMTYGGFTEHMGRCIYGGIYEPGSPHADANGFRKDVLDALRELDIPVIRYPGGNFVATYHWQDGIGPRDKRPKRPELAWLGVESNQFGTDEFMQWLDVLSEGLPNGRRVEPYICLNFGTGTLDEALAWLEYCNGTRDTYYANLRRANGHLEPYRVKYWALGNEVWGPWQVEQTTKEEYARKAVQWAKALRLLDPSITLILCGQDGQSSWDHHVLREAVSSVDMHSIHVYTASNTHLQNATAPLAAERAIRITASLIELARIENNVPPSKPPTKICFDEWNVWDPERAPGDKGAEEQYTLSDALAVGVWLNVFVRQSRYIGMANIAQTVNVISPLLTTKRGVVRQATWWPLLLFSKYMRGWTVAAHVRAGTYDGPTQPTWLQGALLQESEGAPLLDVSAALGDDGFVNLAVVNISEDEDFAVDLKGLGSDVAVYTVAGAQVSSTNTEDKEEVGLSEGRWDGKGKYTFAKHTFTLLRWKS
ncbi:glycoside hydrolase family 51 protein [Hypoxylon trugodes]|uniref:glycoside hydrolase family 51 protein n=1 Tax=Hypoxylon trugodes TaxID=326681 RepID=UPI0021A20454|nr:glycoside hydrolase family 51 protein [Hypoxylon trugodes]KAI1388912.1 glycoside hydrolase family 51 protein [Hypoxylon trugodes]